MFLTAKYASISLLVLLIANNAAALGFGDPCDSDGNLKKWAIADGYSASDCDIAGTDPEEPKPEPEPGEPETPPSSGAPRISINAPASGSDIEEGTPITFNATANDAEDGDLSSKVWWHSNKKGRLSNPTALPLGEHIITAKVRDSDSLLSETSISITVVPAGTATDPAPIPDPTPGGSSVTLSWKAPSTRSDGKALAISEIRGYDLYVIAENSGQDSIVTISDRNTTSHTFNDMAPDTYHFSISTVDTDGMKSQASAIVTTEITSR